MHKLHKFYTLFLCIFDKKRLEFLFSDLFFFDQQSGTAMEHTDIFLKMGLGFRVCLIDNPLHLRVDQILGSIPKASGMRQIPADKYLVIIAP